MVLRMGYAGTTIRAMRNAQGLGLRELAELAGVSYARLSLAERGEWEPTQKWLDRVTRALALHMLDGAA